MSSIYDWSLTAANNATADSLINWAEGQAPSTVNGSARQMMERIAEYLGDHGGALTAGGTANALTLTANSAFTTNVNGRFLAFRAASDNTTAATLNVNGIGAKSIRKMTASGDAALSGAEIQADGIYLVSYSEALNGAAGGWLLVNPTIDVTTLAPLASPSFTGPVSVTSTAAGNLVTVESQDAGASNGPAINLYRNSASPAVSDFIGALVYTGKDSAGNVQPYGGIYATITNATSTTEASLLQIYTTQAGAQNARIGIGNGFYTAGATSGDMGANTINASAYYINGVAFTFTAQATAAQYLANTAGLMLTTDKVWSAAAEVTLTDAATIAVDMNTFINAVVTLGGNRAMGNPSNEKPGQSGCIRIVQDGTGSRTLSYGTDWEFAGGTAPTLSTAAGSNDLLYYYVIATNRVYGNLVKAVA